MAAVTRHSQISPHSVSVAVSSTGEPKTCHRDSSRVIVVSSSSCPTDAAIKIASATQVSLSDCDDSTPAAPVSASGGRPALSVGRTTSISNTRPPTMASAPSSVSHRSNGEKGD